MFCCLSRTSENRSMSAMRGNPENICSHRVFLCLTLNGLSKPQSLRAHTVNERVISARKSALARSYRGDSDAMTDSDARSG
jgi:hypothetical protein